MEFDFNFMKTENLNFGQMCLVQPWLEGTSQSLKAKVNFFLASNYMIMLMSTFKRMLVNFEILLYVPLDPLCMVCLQLEIHADFAVCI